VFTVKDGAHPIENPFTKKDTDNQTTEGEKK